MSGSVLRDSVGPMTPGRELNTTQHHLGRQAKIDVNLRHGPDVIDDTVTPSFLIGNQFPYQRPQKVRVGILVTWGPLLNLTKHNAATALHLQSICVLAPSSNLRC